MLIEDSASFSALLSDLRSELLIAVDTEAASFHRHRDRVYLLQLSTRTTTWVIDPLAVSELPGFGDLLADSGVELVFHDADYDLRLLGHEFGFRVARLFDTRIAAQFLNEPGIGLAALLEKHFGVRLDKRFQRADWSRRPLPAPMLEYAATDTRHLPALRDLLREQLVKVNRLSWVEEECDLLREVRWPEEAPAEVAALSVKGTRTLSPRALAVFRELYVWRERLADSLDRAAFRIAGNEVLLAMAERPPHDGNELAQVRGLGSDVRERQEKEILAALDRGRRLPEGELPRYPRAPRHRPDPAFDRRLERLRAVRSTESERLGLPPGVLAPNWLLENVARRAPASLDDLAHVDGLRRWQLQEFGPQFLRAIK